jgi:hypothetical protein
VIAKEFVTVHGFRGSEFTENPPAILRAGLNLGPPKKGNGNG